MVRSVFNERGVYVGHVWGTQQWGSPDIGSFYARPTGTKETKFFTRLPQAEEYVRARALQIKTRLRDACAPPVAKQLTLNL